MYRIGRMLGRRAAAALFGGLLGTALLAQTAAAQEGVAGPAAGFDKYLVLKEEAFVPNAQFHYAIGHDPSLAHPGDEDSPEIFEGIGAPQVSSAVFSPEDICQSAAGENGGSTSVQSKVQPRMDELTLAPGEKYAKKTVRADLTGITFTEPGIYRYSVSENIGALGQGISLADPTDNMLYLDVYVNSDEQGKLVVAGSVLHRSNEAAAGTDRDTVYDGGFGGEAGQIKPSGFVNRYQTRNVTLKKKVTGNQGDRRRYFEFEVKLEHAVPGTVYGVDLSKADAAVTAGGDKKENPSRLQAGTDGSVLASYYLKDGQEITVRGIAEGTSCRIQERVQPSSGYQVSYTYGQDKEVRKSADTGEFSIESAEREILFTNYRNGIVPTGLWLDAGPAAGLILCTLLALAAVSLAGRKRSRMRREENGR